jgi:glyoxylase-like metal-dependent hydrolase (beta-lactamase superfamily II)
MSSSSLPTTSPAEQESSEINTVRVSALQAGSLTLPEHFFCADQHDKSVKNTVPSLSFLIQHAPSGKRLIFDLGLRRDLSSYPVEIQAHLKSRQPVITFPDVAASLRVDGLQPADIDAVILSHVHYDHVGTPKDFANAYFIVGPGTKHLLQHGMKYHSAAHFEKDLLPDDRTIELSEPQPGELGRAYEKPSTVFDKAVLGDFLGNKNQHAPSWAPRMPFPAAIDLFGDRSLYIISAPGHLRGHINVLARIAVDKWVYLAGDACHHRRILSGETEIALWKEQGMMLCIHEDKAKAEEVIKLIAKAEKEGIEGEKGTVQVILAHDKEWAEGHKEAFFPGHVD